MLTGSGLYEHTEYREVSAGELVAEYLHNTLSQWGRLRKMHWPAMQFLECHFIFLALGSLLDHLKCWVVTFIVHEVNCKKLWICHPYILTKLLTLFALMAQLWKSQLRRGILADRGHRDDQWGDGSTGFRTAPRRCASTFTPDILSRCQNARNCRTAVSLIMFETK